MSSRAISVGTTCLAQIDFCSLHARIGFRAISVGTTCLGQINFCSLHARVGSRAILVRTTCLAQIEFYSLHARIGCHAFVCLRVYLRARVCSRLLAIAFGLCPRMLVKFEVYFLYSRPLEIY